MKTVHLVLIIFLIFIIISILLSYRENKTVKKGCKKLHWGKDNNKLKVLNILSKVQCEEIIKEAQTYEYPITDNKITKDWKCYSLLIENVREYIYPTISRMYNIDPRYLELNELVIVKYNDKEILEERTNGSKNSFIIGLNDDFIGDGIRFSKGIETFKLKTGECLVFSGQDKYGGLEVISGTRYIIKGFITHKTTN